MVSCWQGVCGVGGEYCRPSSASDSPTAECAKRAEWSGSAEWADWSAGSTTISVPGDHSFYSGQFYIPELGFMTIADPGRHNDITRGSNIKVLGMRLKVYSSDENFIVSLRLCSLSQNSLNRVQCRHFFIFSFFHHEATKESLMVSSDRPPPHICPLS